MVVKGMTFNMDIEKVNTLNNGKELKYYIHTFGCQMNVHDSEKLAGMLLRMGYQWTAHEEDADLILYNTCCVREHAELKVYGNIGALKELKRLKPHLMIGICGCMMQQKEVSDFIQKRFPYVDVIFGTHNLHLFPTFLYDAIVSGQNVVKIQEDEGNIIEGLPIERAEGVSTWVTIMYGCENYCTYCIVPYVRGRERSRHSDVILKEIEGLVKSGYKEITLLGQNVNSYGIDLHDVQVNFSYLLREINKIENLYRIRFMTSHPKDLSDDLIIAISECQKVCNQLHLPIQSGSNTILEKMNRRYTREFYIDLIHRIRTYNPNISISTDIIVGFPGESEDDFTDTLDLLKTIQFDSAYTFIYSKRNGTPAATMQNQIEYQVKKERLLQINALQGAISLTINQQYMNQTFDVLVERVSKKHASVLTGRTESGKIVNMQGDIALIGKLVKVKITKSKSWSLEGVIKEENL